MSRRHADAMRVSENSPQRLVLNHRPWVTSLVCWFVIIGIAVKLPWHIRNLTLPDLPIMIAGLLLALPITWWLARWSTFVFDARTGTLQITDRLFPFFDSASRRRSIPIAAIIDVELQNLYDETWMWRAAIIADPARMAPEPAAVRNRKTRLRRHHFITEADGEFPLVPFYTSSESEWARVRDVVRTWLGLHDPAGRGQSSPSQ